MRKIRFQRILRSSDVPITKLWGQLELKCVYFYDVWGSFATNTRVYLQHALGYERFCGHILSPDSTFSENIWT